MLEEHNRPTADELVRIQFYDPVLGYENLWALPLGEGRYRLESVPFFIYDIAVGDVVGATQNERGDLSFLTVLDRSGSRTLRARSDELISNVGLRLEIAGYLKRLGCGSEVLRDRLFAIDIPPTVDIEEVGKYLTKMRLSWEYGSPSSSNA